MIVQRGFPQPPSYHIQRLRDAPAGHFFEVMTNGFGAMYSYAARVEPADRWRIAAYIRVLQLSRNATNRRRARSRTRRSCRSSPPQSAQPSGHSMMMMQIAMTVDRHNLGRVIDRVQKLALSWSALSA